MIYEYEVVGSGSGRAIYYDGFCNYDDITIAPGNYTMEIKPGDVIYNFTVIQEDREFITVISNDTSKLYTFPTLRLIHERILNEQKHRTK